MKKGSFEEFWKGLSLKDEERGRPRNSCMQEVTTGLREWGIGDLEWVDREGWRKKINLLQTQKYAKTSTICMKKNIYIIEEEKKDK